MLKKSIAGIILFLMFTGSVSAESLHGEYDGNAIIKITSGEQELMVEDVPALALDGRTVVPIYMLRELGLDVEWLAEDKTVQVNKPETENEQLKQMITETGNVELSYIGVELTATALVTKVNGEEEDWALIYHTLLNMAVLPADVLCVDYVTEEGYYIGSYYVQRQPFLDYDAGELDDISNYSYTAGNLMLPELETEEIGELSNAVGVVMSYDKDGDFLGQGSGFVIPGGMFITNYHVVEDAAKIEVELDGTTYDISEWYIFENQYLDLYGAELSTSYDENGEPTGKIPDHALMYETEMPKMGQKVYAIGSPNGLENTLSEGIVSSIREIDGITYIQHSADTEPGSSGGALLDSKGRVIGVTTMGIEGTTLDFAIPIHYVINELVY